MRSYIVILTATRNTVIQEANGYHVFAMLCSLVKGTKADSVFHSGGSSGKKSVAITFLRPISESVRSDDAREIQLRSGEQVFSRISFLFDNEGTDFADIMSSRTGQTLRLASSSFILQKILTPGEHPLAVELDPLKEDNFAPYETAGFNFASPTGFKRSGKQFFLPAPELIFGDLLRKRMMLSPKTAIADPELLLPYIELLRYDIKSRAARLREDRTIRGFCGEVEFSFTHFQPRERLFLSSLAAIAFFSGVGYKTTQGLGETIPFWRRN